MPYALELFFDLATEKEVRRVWRSIATRSGSSYLEENAVKPHVALIVFDAPLNNAFADWRQILKSVEGVFALREIGRRVFDAGVAFVEFEKSPVLSRLHDAALGFATSASLRVAALYDHNQWIPHCTLAQKVSPRNIATLQAIQMDYPLECSWTIASAGVVTFPPTVILDEQKIG
jgi:hypothetical protein